MGKVRDRLTYSNVVATICLFLLLGGGAWAAVGSGGDAIHACYSKRTGALRIASRCKHSERALSWSKVGPQGPRGQRGGAGRNGSNGRNGANGAAGLAGATGLAGPAGPSDIYADGKAAGALTSEYVSLGQIVLPPGSYLLEGKASFFSKEDGSEMFCLLAANQAASPYWDAAEANANNGLAATLSLSAVQTFSSPQTVEIICKVQAGSGTFDDTRVTAIKTESLHGTTPRD